MEGNDERKPKVAGWRQLGNSIQSVEQLNKNQPGYPIATSLGQVGNLRGVGRLLFPRSKDSSNVALLLSTLKTSS